MRSNKINPCSLALWWDAEANTKPELVIELVSLP